MKIEKLIPKQEQRMIEVKNEWLDLFFSGKEINKPKAEKLIEWLYEFSNLSKPKVVFVDPFLGSGTTAVAAKYLKRNFIGIEISEKYCKIAEDRLRQEKLF